MSKQELFFSLLRHYLSNAPRPSVKNLDSWQDVYGIARDQALTGILFSVVIGYPKEETASKALLRDWLSDCIVIARKNHTTDGVVGKLLSECKAAGHRCESKDQGFQQ